jgi:cation:H+ antiporter
MLSIVLFIVGFVFLIKGADLLIDGATSIAAKVKMSSLAIGLTVVAFGTSLPELVVNVSASIQDHTGIALSNIIGSNIANILLILGAASIIYPLNVHKGMVWKGIPFCLLASVVLLVLVNDVFIDGNNISELTRIDGIVLLFFFIFFIYYTAHVAKENTESGLSIEIKEYSLLKSMLYIIIGLGGTTLGGYWVIGGAVFIAELLHVKESIIGLTIIAVGTSLPELATSTVAAYKKNVDIAFGNIIGSNIFNILMILGVSALIRPIPVNSKENVNIIIVGIVTVLLFVTMFTGKRAKLDRWEGILFILLYVLFIICQFYF